MLKRRDITNQVKDRLSCGRSYPISTFFFYPTLSLGLTNSLFILLPSWHFVPTWQAGSKVLLRRMRWKKKALLPAGANTPTRHGRRLPTSPSKISKSSNHCWSTCSPLEKFQSGQVPVLWVFHGLSSST